MRSFSKKKEEWSCPVCNMSQKRVKIVFKRKSKTDFVCRICTMCGHNIIVLGVGLFTLKTEFTNSVTLLFDIYMKKF